MLRKMLALTFAGLLTVSVVGCAEKAADDTTTTTPPATETGDDGSTSTEAGESETDEG